MILPNEIVVSVHGQNLNKEEQEKILKENTEAKLRHAARREQERLEKPTNFVAELLISSMILVFSNHKKR
ncbi:MAG: hypothetical protein MJ187_02325 [Alphaproteobacteria bacterium]|nr:hypothetical protein [Alphaproteobacteria bacterium]